MPEGMTREERDRLVVLETEVEQMQSQLTSMDGKLDQLVTAANMGRGAWWLLLKIGGIVVAITTAGAWLYDRFVGSMGPHQ